MSRDTCNCAISQTLRTAKSVESYTAFFLYWPLPVMSSGQIHYALSKPHVLKVLLFRAQGAKSYNKQDLGIAFENSCALGFIFVCFHNDNLLIFHNLSLIYNNHIAHLNQHWLLNPFTSEPSSTRFPITCVKRPSLSAYYNYVRCLDFAPVFF